MFNRKSEKSYIKCLEDFNHELVERQKKYIDDYITVLDRSSNRFCFICTIRNNIDKVSNEELSKMINDFIEEDQKYNNCKLD